MVQSGSVEPVDRDVVGVEPQNEMGTLLYGLDHLVGVSVTAVDQSHIAPAQREVGQAFPGPLIGDPDLDKL